MATWLDRELSDEWPEQHSESYVPQTSVSGSSEDDFGGPTVAIQENGDAHTPQWKKALSPTKQDPSVARFFDNSSDASASTSSARPRGNIFAPDTYVNERLSDLASQLVQKDQSTRTDDSNSKSGTFATSGRSSLDRATAANTHANTRLSENPDGDLKNLAEQGREFFDKLIRKFPNGPPGSNAKQSLSEDHSPSPHRHDNSLDGLEADLNKQNSSTSQNSANGGTLDVNSTQSISTEAGDLDEPPSALGRVPLEPTYSPRAIRRDVSWSNDDHSVSHEFSKQFREKQRVPEPRESSIMYKDVSYSVSRRKLAERFREMGLRGADRYALTSLDWSDDDLESFLGFEEFFPRLRVLSASRNEISNLAGLPSSLVTLDISSNLLGRQTTFPSLTILSELDISNNNLEDLRPLKNLRALRCLRIRRNRLRTLEGIEDLPGLSILDVSYNHLESLHTQLGTLEAVDASHNMIVDAICDEPQLKRLKLDHNALEILEAVPSVEVLNVSYNASLELDLCAGWDSLKYLNYDGNTKFARIAGRGIRKFSWQVTRMPLEVPDLSDFLRDAREIRLSGIPFRVVLGKSYNFACESLDLMNAGLSRIPASFARCFSRLISLNVSGNSLRSLHALPSLLERLSIAGNPVAAYVPAVVHGLRHLKLLDTRPGQVYDTASYLALKPGSTRAAAEYPCLAWLNGNKLMEVRLRDSTKLSPLYRINDGLEDLESSSLFDSDSSVPLIPETGSRIPSRGPTAESSACLDSPIVMNNALDSDHNERSSHSSLKIENHPSLNKSHSAESQHYLDQQRNSERLLNSGPLSSSSHTSRSRRLQRPSLSMSSISTPPATLGLNPTPLESPHKRNTPQEDPQLFEPLPEVPNVVADYKPVEVFELLSAIVARERLVSAGVDLAQLHL